MTTYLDQNALIQLGRKARDPEFRKRLDAAIASGSFRTVVSSWHLIETAHTTNVANAVELAEFIDSLNPLWLYERRNLQIMDVGDDFFRFLKIDHQPEPRLVTRSAVIAAINGAKDGPGFDISSRRMVEQWLRFPDQLKSVEAAFQKNIEALLALRDATKAGKLTEAIRKQADELMVSMSIPARTPSGLEYGRDSKINYIAQFDPKKIPSIALESAISEKEWGDEAVGKADRNTFVDKIHLISALPLVDEIVSDDKFFAAIYPFTVATGHVKAKLVAVSECLKRFN